MISKKYLDLLNNNQRKVLSDAGYESDEALLIIVKYFKKDFKTTFNDYKSFRRLYPQYFEIFKSLGLVTD
jgi:hypothetical protein